MKKEMSVLFLPFLQIPSGHHQVANAIKDHLKEIEPTIHCEKVDILSYSYGSIEKITSTFYLKWIGLFPLLYNFIYEYAVYRKREKEKQYRLYELLFLSFMKKLVIEKRPNLIICTHSLPAYMLNQLKKKEVINVPVINIYTDYFIHRFWGIENIDYHFVPTMKVKQFLLERGVREENIFVTGIPIHAKIKKEKKPLYPPVRTTFTVLISGGSLGVGALEKLIEQIKRPSTSHFIHFIVLCGKNKALFHKLRSRNLQHITPCPYIDCMGKMNDIYDQADAIITKPGGVTISECLFKRKPIFIYHALPGQEKINLEELESEGLVFRLEKCNVNEQLHHVLQAQKELQKYHIRLEDFHAAIHSLTPAEIIAQIMKD